MNFGFSEEQELLRAEVRKYLDQNAPLDEIRKWVESGDGLPVERWREIAELGWVGLTMPEEHGGAGMDWVTLLVVLEETGRTLFPSPLLSTVLAAKAIEWTGSPEQQARWLPALANGSKVATFALLESSDRLDAAGIQLDARSGRLTGDKTFVPDAARADLFVVVVRSGDAEDALSLVVVERGDAGVVAEDYPTMDLTKRVGRLGLEGTPIPPDRVLGGEGTAAATVARLVDTGAALVAAEMVGAAEGALHLTVDFAKERVQFDSPIGRFQGVKHPLAEMFVDVESFKSLVYYAVWALDREAPDASLAVSRAKAYATEAFPRIGIDGVQLHGGVGYTWEYDIQMYLKRSKWARPAFGDADYHYDRIAAQGEWGGE
ncbi:MAG: acyl-CoA/acyl-ACP dehydrogenase [Proteobacteria bacterium]|nr:acyl-CoA/acyl-ACP dehydrogenase [Pseudomonadota bacterium]